MFNENTDLSPDLEWLLLSGKIDDETIIESLARQYYQNIYQLALSRLTYPEEAHRAARETFLQATLSTKNFRCRTNIYEWLVSFATRICQIRSSHLETHLFLNPKLIKFTISQQSAEVLNPDQIEQSIKKIKIQVQNQRAARINRTAYQILGLIIIIILAGYLTIRLSSS
jgi:DNA-directed RNA polymerase specialized sigma24 family protein